MGCAGFARSGDAARRRARRAAHGRLQSTVRAGAPGLCGSADAAARAYSTVRVTSAKTVETATAGDRSKAKLVPSGVGVGLQPPLSW